MKAESRLTVFFEDPFWVAVAERRNGDKLEAAKVVFGAEPKTGEIYQFFLKNWSGLRFSPAVEARSRDVGSVNPKRMKRQVSRQMKQREVGTKSQQALQKMREMGAAQKKKDRREERERAKEMRYEKKQQQKKEKHRGR